MVTRLGVITCLVSSIFLFVVSIVVSNLDISDTTCQVLEESYCKARNQYVYKCNHEYGTIYIHRNHDDFNVGQTLRIIDGELNRVMSNQTQAFIAVVWVLQVIVAGVCLGFLANYDHVDRYGFMR